MPKSPVRTPRTHCMRGHDLREPGGARRDGTCRLCCIESSHRRYHGLPRMPRAPLTHCRAKGHDLRLPNSRASSGRCRACASEADAIRRAKAKAAGERTGHQSKGIVLHEREMSSATELRLWWDARIENECRAWLRDELRQQRDAELARLTGGIASAG